MAATFLPHTPPHRLCLASQHCGVSQNVMVFISWSSPALTTAVDVLPNMRGRCASCPVTTARSSRRSLFRGGRHACNRQAMGLPVLLQEASTVTSSSLWPDRWDEWWGGLKEQVCSKKYRFNGWSVGLVQSFWGMISTIICLTSNLPPPNWMQIHRNYWWVNQTTLWLQGLVHWVNY